MTYGPTQFQTTPADWNSVPPAGRGPHHGGSRVVPTQPMRMETRSCNHRHTCCRGCRQLHQRRLPARWNRCRYRRCSVAVSLAATNENQLCLESLPKKFKKDIANECSCCRNFKIGNSENILDCPHYAPLRPQTRTLKFPHQEIGIKQEDDKAHLDHRPPNILLHRTSPPSWPLRVIGAKKSSR